MRRSSVALPYTAVNVELRVCRICVGTSLRLVRPSLPPTPFSVKSPTDSDGQAWSRLRRRPRSIPAGKFAGRLLEVDACAGPLELGLGLVGLLLGHALEHRLGRRVDQVLGLLQAEAGERADLLDDLDLLLAGGGEDDVELGLLLDLLGRRGGAGPGDRPGDGDRGRRGDAEGLLELLHELRQLQEGHLLEGAHEVVGGQLGHDGCSLLLGFLVHRGTALGLPGPLPIHRGTPLGLPGPLPIHRGTPLGLPGPLPIHRGTPLGFPGPLPIMAGATGGPAGRGRSARRRAWGPSSPPRSWGGPAAATLPSGPGSAGPPATPAPRRPSAGTGSDRRASRPAAGARRRRAGRRRTRCHRRSPY